jgi:hypothetical protein
LQFLLHSRHTRRHHLHQVVEAVGLRQSHHMPGLVKESSGAEISSKIQNELGETVNEKESFPYFGLLSN